MAKSTRWGSLRYRLLAIAVLVICLTSLLASATSPPNCCKRCQEGFQQCDAPDFICCQIYTSCIQQCEGGCPSCLQ